MVQLLPLAGSCQKWRLEAVAAARMDYHQQNKVRPFPRPCFCTIFWSSIREEPGDGRAPVKEVSVTGKSTGGVVLKWGYTGGTQCDNTVDSNGEVIIGLPVHQEEKVEPDRLWAGSNNGSCCIGLPVGKLRKCLHRPRIWPKLSLKRRWQSFRQPGIC